MHYEQINRQQTTYVCTIAHTHTHFKMTRSPPETESDAIFNTIILYSSYLGNTK